MTEQTPISRVPTDREAAYIVARMLREVGASVESIRVVLGKYADEPAANDLLGGAA